MTKNELWNEYCDKYKIDKNTPHEAWSFGDDADELAKLVYMGKKTATSSLYELYILLGEKIPKIGDISIILDKNDQAICIIKNNNVYQTKFGDVSSSYAQKEGEGDLSLTYWKKVHEDFFKDEALENGLSFDDNSLIICEEFDVLYKC